MAQEIRTEEADAAAMSSASLAFLGDSVFEIYIRTKVVENNRGNIGKLNIISKSYSNAKAQAQMADMLQEYFTEEEMTVYKRGRNHKSLSVPRSCSVSEYRRATGLEALMGYLYLSGKFGRISELMDIGIRDIDEHKEKTGEQ